MSGFDQGDQGFYQSNYYDPNAAYDQGGQDAYGQQPYYNQQQGMAPDSMYANTPNAYSGQIMQPQMPAYDGGSNETYSGGFEDEPPLLEELGINFDHISKKTLAVLNPFTNCDPSIVNETDLAGPLVFCLALGGTLLLGGKVSFGYIYGIGGIGILAMYVLLNLMTQKGVSAGCVASIIGYCILPMVLLSSCSIIMSLQGIVGILLSSLIVGWCSLSASKLFVCGLSMESQQLLVAYPCALLYGVFALLTVF